MKALCDIERSSSMDIIEFNQEYLTNTKVLEPIKCSRNYNEKSSVDVSRIVEIEKSTAPVDESITFQEFQDFRSPFSPDNLFSLLEEKSADSNEPNTSDLSIEAPPFIPNVAKDEFYPTMWFVEPKKTMRGCRGGRRRKKETLGTLEPESPEDEPDLPPGLA
eukprot:GDKJ01022832.1.p1 GENE.GDKJ01022832.1~~GDKJ01022832.1.p1  ORF type:complete len:162 (+),score=28.77 GDKJ01022832.1:51-536(+)